MKQIFDLDNNVIIKFLGYDGAYPCLCFGTLKIKVNGKLYCLENALISGGSVTCDDNWNFDVETGDWEVDLSQFPELEPYKKQITELVNYNVEPGCCGGCI